MASSRLAHRVSLCHAQFGLNLAPRSSCKPPRGGAHLRLAQIRENRELFVPDGFKQLAGTMERAEIEIIEGCGHLFMWENVDEVVTRIERFLNS